MLFTDIFLWHTQPFFQEKKLVLRGSFLTKHWLNPHFYRQNKDIDFLANFPYNKAEMENITAQILQSIEKDANFEVIFTKNQLLDTWIDTPVPSFRWVLEGNIKNYQNPNTEIFVFSVDIAFGDTLVMPTLEWAYFSDFLQKNIFTQIICIEQALAWKLHGLVEFYDKGFRWQFKDVYDIYAMLQLPRLKNGSEQEITFFRINPITLQKCLKQAFLDKNTPIKVACKKIFDGSFGQSPNTKKQWDKFLTHDLKNQFTPQFPENISHLEVIKVVRDFFVENFGGG